MLTKALRQYLLGPIHPPPAMPLAPSQSALARSPSHAPQRLGSLVNLPHQLIPLLYSCVISARPALFHQSAVYLTQD